MSFQRLNRQRSTHWIGCIKPTQMPTTSTRGRSILTAPGTWPPTPTRETKAPRRPVGQRREEMPLSPCTIRTANARRARTTTIFHAQVLKASKATLSCLPGTKFQTSLRRRVESASDSIQGRPCRTPVGLRRSERVRLAHVQNSRFQGTGDTTT